MNPYLKKRRELLFAIFDKFPNLSNHGTAKILFRDYPEYFSSKEVARTCVRLYRGKSGKDNREEMTTIKYYR